MGESASHVSLREPSLTVLTGPDVGRRYEFAGRQLLIGRQADCDVVLPSGAVSRQHARIVQRDDGYYIEDLQSLNGTFVNGERVDAPCLLAVGDRIQLHDVLLSFDLALGTDPAVGQTPPVESTPAARDTSVVTALDVSGGAEQRLEVNPHIKLKAILDLLRDLGASLEVDEMLSRALESLFRVFPQAERGYVFLKDESTGQLTPRAVKRGDDDEGAATLGALSTHLAERVLAEGAALLSSEGGLAQEAAHTVLDLQIRVTMAAPLALHGQLPWGVLQLSTNDIRRPFVQADLDVLASVAAPIAHLVHYADSQQRRGSERARRESEERFRQLTEVMPQLVWSARPDGFRDYCNSRWLQFAGLTAAEAAGDGWRRIVHPEDRGTTVATWEQALVAGSEYQTEHRLRGTDGRYRWFLSRALPLRDPQGRIVRWFGTSTDIEALRQAEEALEAAKSAAEQANRTKGEFLANVSHELRTPMTAILGMTQLALDERLDEPARTYLETAHDSAHGLLALLDEILDFSRIEAGKFALDSGPFDLRATVEQAVKLLAPRAYAKGLELACDVPASVPDALVGDPLRLRQVLTNLVGNAIKFTERGEVVVSVRREPSSDRIVLRFDVADTGIGISREKQAAIFAPFAQADSSTTRHYGGTGLGLTIAAELVARMEGQLGVESVPGRGSTFSFTARFVPADTDTLEEPAGIAFPAGLRVLVAAGRATEGRIVRDRLREWGLEVELVGQAQAAWQRVADACLPVCDLLLWDGDLIDDGQPPASGSPAPRLAPTVLVGAPGRRPTFSGRHDAYLERPVTVSGLRAAVVRALGLETTDEAPDEVAGREPVPTAETPLRVLVAEDTPANQQMLLAMLRRGGHEVTLAVNGREAVELAARDRFDIVLMDVQMPIVDGFEATAAIRADDARRGRRTPILAMTARAMRGDRQRCLDAGMDDYLAKPIDGRMLLDTLSRVASEFAGPAAVLAGPTAEADVAGTPWDPGAALARLAGDETLLVTLIDFYLEDGPKLLADFRAGLASQDAALARRAAHSLKGLSSSFDAARAVSLAGTIEDLAALGRLAECAERLPDLERAISELSVSISHYRGAVVSAAPRQA